MAPEGVRLVWRASADDAEGLWTTALDGSDPKQYAAQESAAGIIFRDPRLIDGRIVAVAVARGLTASELVAVDDAGVERVLPDVWNTYLAFGDSEAVATVGREVNTEQVVRVRLAAGAQPQILGPLPPLRSDMDQLLMAFGFAVSPDGRSVSAGRDGGPIRVWGPVPGDFADLGAPVVVTNEGEPLDARHILADAGALPETIVDGPVAEAGTSTVVWIIRDPQVLAVVTGVVVRDVLTGDQRRYPVRAPVMDILAITDRYVLFEEPRIGFIRGIGYLDRQTGNFSLFEVPAPS